MRVGAPLRQEFAAWRYGDQFGRRRVRSMVLGGAGAALLVGGGFVDPAILGGSGLGGYWLWQMMDVWSA
ncbi:MAG: hypothetical protein P8170_17600, partial [Gemmatimonadota bacterium]